MDEKRVLHGMIEIYQNDFMGGYEEADKEKIRLIFLELILSTTRYVNNYRYCSKNDCPCSPEFEIKQILKNHNGIIFKTLFGSDFALTEIPVGAIRKFLYQFSA